MKNNKNIKKIYVVFFIIGALFFCFGVFLSINKGENKRNNSKKDAETFNINGLYKQNDIKIYLYEINDSIMIHIYNDVDISIRKIKRIHDNIIELNEEKITIELKNNSIQVSSENEKINGNYTKDEKYTLDDYYNEFFCNDESLNNSSNIYNVHYTKDNYDLYMYQENKEKVHVKIAINNGNKIDYYESKYTIKDKNTLVNETSINTFKITIENDSLTILGLEKLFTEEKYANMNGKYTKVKNLSKEEIIKLFL